MKYKVGDKVIGRDHTGVYCGTISEIIPQRQHRMDGGVMYRVQLAGADDYRTRHDLYETEIFAVLDYLDGLEFLARVHNAEEDLAIHTKFVMDAETALERAKIHHREVFNTLLKVKADAKDFYAGRKEGTGRWV